jgi:ubiquinone/menaquinone biosynthesis C-methylase UbiE
MSSIETSPRASLLSAYFGKLAATYGEGEYYAGRRGAVIAAIEDEVSRAHDLLDLGCGNGIYLQEFAVRSASGRLVGLDLTPEMLREARRRVPSRCALVCADASNLPCADSIFDVIFASHVLQFVPNLDDTVARVARCLKEQGVLIATYQGGESSVRSKLSEIVGPEVWRDFAGLVLRTSTQAIPRESQPARFEVAFAKAKLKIEKRSAPMTVAWPAIQEWIEIRWMPVVPESERDRASRMLAEIAKLAARATFAIEEPMLLGRRTA